MSSGHNATSDNAGQPSSGGSASPIKGVALFVILVLIVAVVLAATGILGRSHSAKVLADETNEAAIPQVQVIEPKQGTPAQEIQLPGNMQAFKDAPIFARTDGYLKSWSADIGAHVKQGQLLAVIDSPEIDQQLQQARADLGTAQANLQIAQVTSNRYNDLVKSNSVSVQDAQNMSADAQARLTQVHSAEANVKRLEQLQSFERITAPFDGVITARNTDYGQLITAGSGGGAGLPGTGQGRELFHIASVNTLRVFVNVPQIYSRDAKPSSQVNLTLPQFPGRTFTGKLVRNANSIDLATRTLLVEVDVDNRSGELLPGSFTQVHLKLDSQTPTVMLPVSALIFRTEGLQVATLDSSDHTKLTPITVGRDYGTQVEVVSGLEPGQRVVDSPPDSLANGERVKPLHLQVPPKS